MPLGEGRPAGRAVSPFPLPGAELEGRPRGRSGGRKVDTRGHWEAVSPQGRQFLSGPCVPSHTPGAGRAGGRPGGDGFSGATCDHSQHRPGIRLGGVVPLLHLQDAHGPQWPRAPSDPIPVSCWAFSSQLVGSVHTGVGLRPARPAQSGWHTRVLQTGRTSPWWCRQLSEFFQTPDWSWATWGGRAGETWGHHQQSARSRSGCGVPAL